MPDAAPIVISIAAAVVSATSAVIAFFSYRLARQTLRLNRQLADRRQPRLLLAFQEGYKRKSGSDTIYALLIAINNPTDVDNAVSQFDLRVDYRPSSGFCARVDVPATSLSPTERASTEASPLVVPVKVGAHQTAIGWAHFRLNPALFADCRIDAYTVIARDPHGESSLVEISVLREVNDVGQA